MSSRYGQEKRLDKVPIGIKFKKIQASIFTLSNRQNILTIVSHQKKKNQLIKEYSTKKKLN